MELYKGSSLLGSYSQTISRTSNADLRGNPAIPHGIVPGNPAILRHPAVRERDVEPLIRLIGPCVPKPEQLADRPAVRAVPGIAAGKPAYGGRKPERVRSAGIDTHPEGSTRSGEISLDYDFFHSHLMELSCGNDYTVKITPKDT